VVAKDWNKRFPDNASQTTSTMLFLVRKGNPKGIKDWDDLTRPGVHVVLVNPKTGGNGRYAYLAAWGYAKKKGATDAQAADFVGKLYKNVPVLGKGGRDATTIFLQHNTGDVLITFESEVLSVNREFGEGRSIPFIRRSACLPKTRWLLSSGLSPRRVLRSSPKTISITCTPTKGKRSPHVMHCARVLRPS
jgi:sulfate/thiosulfate-binding protein